jgi:hypothetical protein
MVLASKVFNVREKFELDLLAEKLKSFKIEQQTTIEEKDFTLISEITDLNFSGNALEGTFSFDVPFILNYRGNPVPLARTYEAPFSFDLYKARLFLSVYEKKNRANNVANEMSKAIFLSLGQIVEGRILPEVLKGYHEQNFDDTKIIFFDDIDLPNISKLSLYGSALGSTSLYTDYLEHGKLWYTVIKSRKYGYVVGLTRNCVVTVFSRLDLPEFKSFIRGEVLPLIS